MFVTAITALCGKATICLDRPRDRALVAALEPLGVSAGSAPQYAYDYCRGLAQITGEHFARSYAYWLDLERRLHAPGGLGDLPAEGLRCGKAACTTSWCVRELHRRRQGARACGHARTRRESTSTSSSRRSSAAVPRVPRRIGAGENRVYAMEACAVQSGSTWQVQTGPRSRPASSAGCSTIDDDQARARRHRTRRGRSHLARALCAELACHVPAAARHAARVHRGVRRC